MAESPESPLSSLASDDEIAEEVATPLNRSTRPSISTPSHDTDTQPPPSKRRRTGGNGAPGPSSNFSTFSAHEQQHTPSQPGDDDDDVSMSEDGFSSAPGSPAHDEHAMRAEQVTACQWEACPAGDLGNSDELVRHVQNDHISPRRARYTCEWGDCARKGTNHPSGYALKAHMRSHTKEKPFFCALPGEFWPVLSRRTA